MNKQKPIKRHKAIQPLSRDHHHSLLLSWKIRTGFSKGIAPDRIKKYVDWFFIHHVKPHFELEEQYMFPILGPQNENIKKAISEHRRLTRLFNETDGISKSLSLIEEELERHIRFEERILFNEIQQAATDAQLQNIEAMHDDEKFRENTEDEFWK